MSREGWRAALASARLCVRACAYLSALTRAVCACRLALASSERGPRSLSPAGPNRAPLRHALVSSYWRGVARKCATPLKCRDCNLSPWFSLMECCVNHASARIEGTDGMVASILSPASHPPGPIFVCLR